jgi:hypothetical protein
MKDRNLPPMPRFATEAEEAQWVFDHRDDISLDFAAAIKNGTLGEGSMACGVRKRQESEQLLAHGQPPAARALPPLPKFRNETEEAQCIFNQRDELSEDILSAAKNGTLGEGSLGRAARKQKEAQRQETTA